MKYYRHTIAAVLALILLGAIALALEGSAGSVEQEITQAPALEAVAAPLVLTITVTPEPTPASAEPVRPARYELTPEERDTVERVVMAEAGGEDFDGQALVAQCVLNTSEARAMRPDAVVLEAGQYAAPAQEASESVKKAVAAVFDGGYAVTAEPVRFFYAPRYCYSAWHESKVFILEHGGHRFFK